jgi:periplasmic divalent cation tolerance protein
MNSQHIVIFNSCPDQATADRIARALVEERLAACVNQLAAVRSIYRWQGKLDDEPEVLLLIKTTVARLAELEMRLRAMHPYEVPEIIALPVIGGSADYLAWVARETSATEP